MLHKVLADEHPAAADLGAGDLPRLGALAQLLRVQAQELRRLVQVESVHCSVAVARRRLRCRDYCVGDGGVAPPA